MKKIKIFLFSIWLVILIIPTTIPAKAEDNCVWRTESIQTNPELGGSQVTGGCYSDEARPGSDSEKKCSGTKPADSSSGSTFTRYICCCEVTQAPVQPKTPKFIMPELQISIPTLKLTASSSIEFIRNNDGSTNVSIPWISEYILAIYNYGLSAAGILAAIILMAGGVLWLVSGGDASKVTQAKELITGSVVGLVILASSYIILTQINPDLVKFKPITLGAIKYQDFEPVSSEGNPNNSADCLNCKTLSSPIPYKNGSMVNTVLDGKLFTAYQNSAGLAWQVTEAYKPTSTHKSTCHYNGMCVDVALTTDKSCTAVDTLITILKNAGLSVLNEYPDCSGTTTTYATGGHLHAQ